MIINGTTYHDETPRELAEILERCRENGTPVLIRYGDRQTGRDWMEENDVRGRLARSMGPVKVPLLIAGREVGGPSVLDHCIVKLVHDKTRAVLWKHRTYNRPAVTLHPLPGWHSMAKHDGEVVARFSTARQERAYMRIMAEH